MKTSTYPTSLVVRAARAALALLVAGLLGLAPATAAAKGAYPVLQSATAGYATPAGAQPQAAITTVPTWHGSYVDGRNGRTYSFDIVGTDPSLATSTMVGAEIIPVTFAFAADGGATVGAGQAPSWVSQSPLFAPAPLPSGETAQYLEGEMRAEFDKIGSGYHLQLDDTGTLPAVTLTVPSADGSIYQTPRGVAVGLVNIKWFSGQLATILGGAGVSPTTLPIVLGDNVLMYQGSVLSCCILGFHGSEMPNLHSVQTYAWASWLPPLSIFPAGLTDVSPLSHEVAEWAHDPFGTNYVGPWRVPGHPLDGCSNVLETGDPLVGTDFAVGASNPDPATGPAWHLQDEAYLWWFERQPSQASNGAYSYLGTFTTAAPGCL